MRGCATSLLGTLSSHCLFHRSIVHAPQSGLANLCSHTPASQPHPGLLVDHLGIFDQVTVCTESKPADETLNAPTLDDKMALVNQKAESKVSLTMLMTSLTVPYPIRPPLIADCPYPVSEPLRASSPCPMRCRAVELTFHMDPIACALPDDLLPAVLPALAVPHCPPFLSPHLFASALLLLLPSSLPPPCAPSALLDHIPSTSSHSLPYTSAIINLVEILGMLVR